MNKETIMEEGYREMAEENLLLAEAAFPVVREVWQEVEDLDCEYLKGGRYE